MRTRLSALLLVLIGVVLVSLGIPLISGMAADEARTLHTDRMADLSLFVSRAPFGEEPGAAEVMALERDLERYEELYGISVTVYDAARHPRYSNADSAALSVAEDAALDTALSGRLTEVWDHIQPWDSEPLVAAQPVVRDGDVVGAVVSVSPVEKAANRVLARWSILLAAELVAMIGAIALVDRLARWLLRPVARLDEAAHQISAGDLSARVPTGSGPPELRRLEASFNDMAVHVQDAVEAQRAFVADASHQLRNPLAALLMRLEGLAMTSGLPGVSKARQTELMEQALADGRHLAGTLDRMLALAKVENAGAPAVALDVAAVVDERLAFWMVVADRRGVHIVRRGAVEAQGLHDAGALAGALDAVLDNALKYSPEGGTVTVEVRSVPGAAAGPGPRDVVPIGGPSSAPMLALAHAVEVSGPDQPPRGGAEVTVTDDGPGVSAQDLPRIADRFWRAEGAEQEGTGLGMSIAKTLMERHDGSLEATTGEAGGLSVRLVIPPAS
ncbi:HAMP domain-containing histidine kinase [Kineosporia rhizophila]|uniref:sensor histidine kinase n=1 Tax=Kineosporia TaxID=49184 RepID=UPI001E2C3346|nr:MULTISPECIES: HAMP domain-containing sensor histidine kinase [Kineosporia]MCE0540245.1 HAMP domain-containing histidine kinase [Kineosporia rhizophila]GLY16294.1 two-component sensor histidine kinase [Kineosporia sp. NBRC 101677]